jgi:hypothetical protein
MLAGVGGEVTLYKKSGAGLYVLLQHGAGPLENIFGADRRVRRGCLLLE